MEEMSWSTMLAVMEEVFGHGLFWTIVALATLVTVTYLYVLIRDRALGIRQFLIAQLFMPLGAVVAVWFVMVVTRSRLADIGGPVDVILLLGIAAAGAIGLGILVYTVEALVRRK